MKCNNNSCSCNPSEDDIFRNDDLDAFDQEWCIIEADIPEGWVISKADFGNMDWKISFDSPVFPLKVALNSEQTRILKAKNEAFLVVYDNQGRHVTCEGSLVFGSRKQAVK